MSEKKNLILIANINLCKLPPLFRNRQCLMNTVHAWTNPTVKVSSTLKESERHYRLTILMWPIPPSWSLENTMSPTENSILERDSPLMSPWFPSPSLYETSVAAAPLCSCQQGRVCVFACVCTSWGGVGWEVSVGRVMTPPPLEGSSPHTCGTSHLSMANSH